MLGLPLLVLEPQSGCGLACRMCEIWRQGQGSRLDGAALAAEAGAWRAAGLSRVLLSGGEPLMHPDLWGLIAPLTRRDIGITLLAAGPGLAEQAPQIARHVDDLVVSLDGPPAVHDRIRGRRGAFDLLARGLAAVRPLAPGLRVGARCTVQRGNHDRLCETLRTADELGLDSLSFLAVDVHSQAFNRSAQTQDDARQRLLPRAREIDALALELEALLAEPAKPRLVVESSGRLRARLVDHFRALSEGREPAPGSCNAPWVSAVIEADGQVRPCFFHAPIGRWPKDGGLLQILGAEGARRFRARLDPRRDPQCRACVCRLNLAPPTAALTAGTRSGVV